MTVPQSLRSAMALQHPDFPISAAASNAEACLAEGHYHLCLDALAGFGTALVDVDRGDELPRRFWIMLAHAAARMEFGLMLPYLLRRALGKPLRDWYDQLAGLCYAARRCPPDHALAPAMARLLSEVKASSSIDPTARDDEDPRDLAARMRTEKVLAGEGNGSWAAMAALVNDHFEEVFAMMADATEGVDYESAPSWAFDSVVDRNPFVLVVADGLLPRVEETPWWRAQ